MAYGDNPGDDAMPSRDDLLLFDDDAERAKDTCPCPYCGATAGQPCRNKITGHPLHKSHTHTPRTRAATPEDVF